MANACDAAITEFDSNSASRADDHAIIRLNTRKSDIANACMILWETLLLRRLDYCTWLWSYDSSGIIEEIESLKRIFTNKMSSVNNLIAEKT